MKQHKSFMLLMVFVMIASVLASCAAPTTQAPAAPTEAPAAATQAPAAPTQAPAAATQAPASTMKKGPFTIGISNPFISSEYRTQMIQELKDVNAEYMAQGLTNDLVIESADTDVAGQIQQLQNLISKNVDAILVNPGDVNGLNATLEDAVNKGIIVISVDQEIGSQGCLQCGHRPDRMGQDLCPMVSRQIRRQGQHRRNRRHSRSPRQCRPHEWSRVSSQDYPDIKVLGKDTGNWDEATGQQVMSNFLASFPTLSGYWTQDGMAIGALQAVMAANPATWPVAVGEGRCQYLKLWDQAMQDHPNFDSIAVANPPGVAATGLRIAVNMLQGKQLDTSKLTGQYGHMFTLPIPVVVTKDNFKQVLATCDGKPDAYLLDGIMTDAEVQQFFVGGAAPAASTMKKGPFTIGISNPFISSEYRTQMIQELKDVNAEYMAKGITNDLVIESADTDVAGQIQQLQNLISKNVDAILVNPGDVNGLNATLEEAVNKGIIVISVDQEIGAKGVYNVGIDQKRMGQDFCQMVG